MTINEAYKILEISENSSGEEIKLAYKKLAKKYHPDFYQNNPLADLAEEKLKEVNEAYKIIKEFVKIDETIKKNYENNSSNKEIVVKKFQILGYEISFNSHFFIVTAIILIIFFNCFSCFNKFLNYIISFINFF